MANYLRGGPVAPPTLISLTGLVAGTQYELQIYFMDQRTSERGVHVRSS